MPNTPRTPAADRAIDVLRLLWVGDATGVSFAGEFFTFTNLVSRGDALGIDRHVPQATGRMDALGREWAMLGAARRKRNGFAIANDSQ
jgi:hypothetical protein